MILRSGKEDGSGDLPYANLEDGTEDVRRLYKQTTIETSVRISC